jgi:hypothetical protein
MYDVAIDSVRSLAPRSGERVGVRGFYNLIGQAPHPIPLPVKNGEREQTEFAARA